MFIRRILLSFLLMAVLVEATSEKAISYPGDNDCAIWLCLPLAFIPGSCAGARLAFIRRQANPFQSAIPSLPSCIVSEQTAISRSLSEGLTSSATTQFINTRRSDDGKIDTDTFRDCFTIRNNGVQIGQTFCADREEERDVPLEEQFGLVPSQEPLEERIGIGT